MASVNDIYRIQYFYTTSGGGPAVDTYYYRVEDTSGANAENLLGAFGDKFDADLIGALNENLDIFERVVINGMDNGDFTVNGTVLNGTRTGAVLPPALTPIFRSGRAQPGDRYSWHRPPLGSVSDLAASGLWATGFQGGLNDLANGMNDVLSHSPGAQYTPVQITGGFKLGTSPTLKRVLTLPWVFGTQPHWLDSREPEFAYAGPGV